MTGQPPVDELVSVARARLGLPGGSLDGDVDRFYPEAFDDCHVVPVFDGEEGRPVVVYAPGGRIAAHGGLAVAAARLRDLRVLDHDPDTVQVSLRPLLEAVGGMAPGRPQWPDERVDVADGAQLVLTEVEGWVRFAAAGALGPPPLAEDRLDARGITPPSPEATMTAVLDGRYRLRWIFAVDGEEVASLDADPDDAQDEQGEPAPVLSEWAVAAARRMRRAPLAVASRPVVAAGEGSWTVGLIGAAEPVIVGAADLEAVGMPHEPEAAP